MGKIIGVMVFVILLFITYVIGFHERSLANREAEAVLSQWRGDRTAPVDLLSDYAPLPEYDRRLIAFYCTEVYERYKRLEGTRDILEHDYRPGCQVLLYAGWYPGWTIADGIDYIRRPGDYRR